jgi:flavin-dependent thymidylate synthase
MTVNNNQIQVELQDWMGSDRAIAEAAWTSSNTLSSKNSKTDLDVERIVKLLIDQKHASPIESVVLRFWIKMPIQTDRQHMTHRIGSHNGMSGRYRTMPSEWLNIPDDIKEIMSRADNSISGEITETYKELCKKTNLFYSLILKEFKGCEEHKIITNKEYKRCREFFRGVLPQNNMTERVTIFNLRSFANYQKLRNSEHAQPEIRKVAELMLEAVEKANVCPIAISALKANNWNI